MKIESSNKYFDYDNPRPVTWKSQIKKAFLALLSNYYQVKYHLIKVPIKDKKYNVSICAIFKNEAPYLKEWIEYHKIIGIEHFFLYNNLSEDNYEEVLAPYVADGTVTLVQWPYPQTQMKAYNNCMERFSDQSKWIGFVDIDEFVVPKSTHNIYSFLKDFEKYPAVLMYWRLFGSSALMNRDLSTLVTDSFFSCWPKYDEIGKCFFNTAYELDMNYTKNAAFHHFVWGKYKGKYYPPVNVFGYVLFDSKRDKAKNGEFPIQINHYFTKSYGEYLVKKSKGDVFFKANPHDLEYFYKHEMRCTGTDYSIYKYLVKLKLAMGVEK